MAITRNTTLVKPGPIGRIGRFILGALSISFAAAILPDYSFFININPLNNSSPYLIGVFIAFIVFSDVINIGFNVSWGRRPQEILLVLVFLAIGLNLLLSGTIWGSPLGVVLYLMSIFTHFYLGSSHILAALIATPGCEMRSIPHLVAKIRGRDIEGAVCPGHWDDLDKWEASK